MRLDAELLGEGVDRIQREVALATLDAGKVPSRHSEFFGKTFLRQVAHKTQVADLRSEHLLQRFCHTSSLMPGSHDFQEVIASSCGPGVRARLAPRPHQTSKESVTMPDPQQIPEDGPNALPRVLHTPRSRALLSESWAQAEEAKREEWAGNDPQLPYEAYAAGEPCRACGRALLGEPALGTDEESIALIDADNAEFRAEHEACNMGVWRLAGNRVEHCHLCCPFPPLSPTQRDEFRQLLYPSSLRIDRSAIWRVELTCQHVETLAGQSPLYVEPTARCTICVVIRGVVKAMRIDDQTNDGDDSSDIEGLQPGYQRLTDEQWSWIKHIVHSEEGPRRGRPRTDIRTIVDAALYKTRTGITWRELPAEFGSWQTALRRHRQLVASSQWDEITRTLAERDLPQ